MINQSQKRLKKKIQEQDDQFYGEETESGSSPRPSSDDSVDKDYRQAFGNKPKTDIGEEINEDEKDLIEGPDSEDEDEE